MMWGHYGAGAGWAGWLVMFAGMLAFWVIIVLLVRVLWRGGRSDSRIEASRSDPLTLLKEGLARGDISPEQYEQRRRILADGY